MLVPSSSLSAHVSIQLSRPVPRRLRFQFEVDESDDWICRAANGNRVLACTNCDRWYMHNSADCDKPCRMCKSPLDQHTRGCIRYRAWARKHGRLLDSQAPRFKGAKAYRPHGSTSIKLQDFKALGL